MLIQCEVFNRSPPKGTVAKAVIQSINPVYSACTVQVIDLSKAGPGPGLELMKHQESFRALGCGGDGTIGWILQEADKRGITNVGTQSYSGAVYGVVVW